MFLLVLAMVSCIRCGRGSALVTHVVDVGHWRGFRTATIALVCGLQMPNGVAGVDQRGRRDGAREPGRLR